MTSRAPTVTKTLKVILSLYALDQYLTFVYFLFHPGMQFLHCSRLRAGLNKVVFSRDVKPLVSGVFTSYRDPDCAGSDGRENTEWSESVTI